MINRIEYYTDAGTKAGKASRKRDYSLMNHLNRWLTAAVAIEQGEDKVKAREAYNKAYRDATSLT